MNALLNALNIKDKSQLATISGMCFAVLAAFLYFTLWFGPWSIMDSVTDKVGYTALAIAVAVISAIAVLSREYGIKHKGTTGFITSFTYGIFPIVILTIVIYLVASGTTNSIMAVYVLISSFVSGFGTYLLLNSLSMKGTSYSR